MAERVRDRPTRPSAAGERAALGGYIPQYEVAADLALRALVEQSLDWISILDPAAGRLDDFQIATAGRLDAYQIKWSASATRFSWPVFRSLLLDLLRDRNKLASVEGQRTVVAHLTTNRGPSGGPSFRLTGADGVRHHVLADLVVPATRGQLSLKQIPDALLSVWTSLAADAGLSASELVEQLSLIRLEFDTKLPSRRSLSKDESRLFVRDVREVRNTLFDAAVDPRMPRRIDRAELLRRLPPTWSARLDLRSVHEISGPPIYEPVSTSVNALGNALSRHRQGYLAVVGAPGSGKSTLLSQELRGRSDVVARYYAYVRDRPDIGNVRVQAESFLHDLVLTLERDGVRRSLTPLEPDVALLSRRLEQQLAVLGERFASDGKRAVIVVDGLDHADRAPIPNAETLLRYLPLPSSIPDGVLFVLGTQVDTMLDPAIRAQLEEEDRTVRMVGLDGAAIDRLAQASGIAVPTAELLKASDGHPLLVAYLLRELSLLEGQALSDRLRTLPRYGGEVDALYRELWSDVEADDEAVELLGLGARLRNAIDFSWLVERGQAPPTVRRVLRRFGHLFRLERGRHHFFHESFKLFLEERTATLGTHTSASRTEDARFHATLAAMAEASAEGSPHYWEVLFHLAASGQHARVLDLARVAFFRDQLFAFRPAELVEADVRLAARSLAEVRDPMALVRLAIAAGEIQQRGYHAPARDVWLHLLQARGGIRTVVDALEVDRDDFAADNGRTLPIRHARQLASLGYIEEARRLLAMNEPLDLLSGDEGELLGADASELLQEWARTAVVLRGAEAVIEAANTVVVKGRAWAGQPAADWTPAVRGWMLAVAAEQAETLERWDEADQLAAAVSACADGAATQVAWLSLQRARCRSDGALSDDDALFGLDPEKVSGHQRVSVAEALFKLGRVEGARQWIASVTPPAIASPAGFEDAWEAEVERLRFERLRKVLGVPGSPEQIIPDGGPNDRPYVLLSRSVVEIAHLGASAWCGKPVDSVTFVATVRRLLGRLDQSGGRSPDYVIRRALPHVLCEMLTLAEGHGRDAVRAFWAEVLQRWKDPAKLLSEASALLPVASQSSAIDVGDIRRLFAELVTRIRETTDSQILARELADAASLALDLGLEDEVDGLMLDAARSTLAIYERKDHQLADWLTLMEPLFAGDSDGALAVWCAGSVRTLESEGGGGQALTAAEALLGALAKHRAQHALAVGRWLDSEGVIEAGDRLRWLLEATPHAGGSDLWWTALSEGVLPVATTASSPDTLAAAARETLSRHDQVRLAKHLRHLVGRARVDGPTHTRADWLEAAAEVGSLCGLAMDEIGLSPEDDPSSRPPRSRVRGLHDDDRDAFLRDLQTVDALLANSGTTGPSHSVSDWNEALSRLAPDISRDELCALAERVDSSNPVGALALARRAVVLGESSVARALIDLVLQAGDSAGWRRSSRGGLLLQAFRLDIALNGEAARTRAYRRFAADASSDPYLLQEVSRDLGHFLEIFPVDDPLKLGREVEAYVRVLTPPAARVPDLPAGQAGVKAVIAATILDLLTAPQRLAVQCGQRAVVRALMGDDLELAAQLGDQLDVGHEEVLVRVFSALQAAVRNSYLVTGRMRDAVAACSGHSNLAVRQAACRLLRACGDLPQVVPGAPLPATFRIEMPERSILPSSGLQGSKPLGTDDLAATALAAGIDGVLVALARAAGVGLAQLETRVEALARQAAPQSRVDDSSRSFLYSSLGWSYFKPSISLWEHAAYRAAAELVDAGRIQSRAAEELLFGRLCEPELIRRDPARRPACVPAASDGRRFTGASEWKEGIGDGSSRLAALDDEWVVIGELTEVVCLDHELPREKRSQCLGGRQAERFRELSIDDASLLGTSDQSTPVIRNEGVGWRGPNEWIAFHPGLAKDCGLSPDPTGLFAYRDELGLAVESRWWREGSLYAGPATGGGGTATAGEGWLVVVAERLLDPLSELLGGLTIMWSVERSTSDRSASKSASRTGCFDLIRPRETN